MTREEFMDIVYSELYSDGDNYRANRIIDAADEYAEDSSSEKPNKWIPISEKLPEEMKSVLVYAPEYNNIYCAYLDGDTWFIFGGYGSYAVANVTAWMPLPYEPQESEE